MLITLRDVLVRFTAEPVLDHIGLTIQEGERVCLAGRNGAGKSTLMRVLAGHIGPDSGEIERRSELRVTMLAQDVPEGLCGSVYDIVTRGMGTIGRQLLAYQEAISSGASPQQLIGLEHALEEAGAWNAHVDVAATLSRMELDPHAQFDTLSGGLRRRVMLAQALVGKPDLLLLDEPTNHLDIAGVTWLEDLVLSMQSALVFITHDRAFLDRVATRIVEVDRGRLFDFPADFSQYRRMKNQQLGAEQRANHEFDKRLAEEEAWIRRGVKARTTRNMGRVRTLEQMRVQAAARRQYQRRARMRAQFGEASSRRVIEAYRLNATIAGKTVLSNFTHKIRRGECIGVMGPNGSGKTTLLRLLLGLHAPSSGTLKYGENIQFAYFDQRRQQLDLERSAAWNVADGADRIDFEGKSLHVLGYLRAFLFTPDRARSSVKVLSGGERNRLLLARLFAKPSNVLVLDEPTNDLDIETLELLEDLINDYPGTIILVSHDRAFVDNVVDGLLVHEGENGFQYYIGGYRDWMRQRRSEDLPERASKKDPIGQKPKRPRKLSYKDQRELDELPARIEALEEQIAALHEHMGHPDFFRGDAETIKSLQCQLARLQSGLQEMFARWELLETRRAALKAGAID